MNDRATCLQWTPYLAEDLWAEGRRDEARVVLHDAWHEARRMGAGTVAQHLQDVAVRRRVALPEQVLSPLEARLTPREREVLALLDEGATNKQIAERLFITEKTASVHVSNLMAKLGASHRGEAVALARGLRLGEAGVVGR